MRIGKYYLIQFTTMQNTLQKTKHLNLQGIKKMDEQAQCMSNSQRPVAHPHC